MSLKNEQFEEMTDLLNKAIPVIKTVLTDFNKSEDVPSEIAVYQNLLQRFSYCIQSVECLLKRFNHDANFKFPIGLLIRNGLLDFITAAYLFEKGHRENNFSNEFAKINHQFVNTQYKASKKLQDNGEISMEMLQEEIIELQKWYPENFELDENGQFRIKRITSIKPSEMAKELTQYSQVYNLYDYYSRYEHYGKISKLMIDGRPEYDFDKLKVALWYIFLGVILCFEIMGNPVDHKNAIDEIRNKVLAMPEVCSYPEV